MFVFILATFKKVIGGGGRGQMGGWLGCPAEWRSLVSVSPSIKVATIFESSVVKVIFIFKHSQERRSPTLDHPYVFKVIPCCLIFNHINVPMNFYFYSNSGNNSSGQLNPKLLCDL